MSIAISLPDDFDIENYEGLQAFLINHLELDTGTQAQLANLIRLAELRLARKITSPERETESTLTTTPAAQTVLLPTDCAQVRQLRIIGDTSTGYVLQPTTPNVVEAYDYAGRPVMYAIHGPDIILGPIPDTAYTLKLRYQAELTPLTDNSQTNWLLAGHADAYVYMASAVISQHLADRANAALYLSLADAVIDEINEQGSRYRNAVPMRLQSPVVV